MVSNGTIESTVLKAKYGADIRKSQLHHTQDLNFNDLVLMMQRVFQIKSNAPISLKYRDSESDWITLANDDDVVFALQHEPSLYVEVFTDGDRVSRQISPITATDSIITSRNSVKEEVAYDRHTPQRQTAPVGQDLSTPTPTSQDGHLQQKSFSHVDPALHKEIHGAPPSNQYQQDNQPTLPSAQDHFNQFSNFQQQPPSDGNGVDASGPPVIQPSVQKEVNVSSAYGSAPPNQPTPQRPPSISQNSQYGSMTPPVSNEYQYSNNYQQPQHPLYSATNEYSAPPTIQPSVHKEVVVSSAYGQSGGIMQPTYPGQQQPPQQAPPLSHQPPSSVGGGSYGAVAPPPVSQYNAPPQQPPMAQPPQHMPPYSGGAYQPATNYGASAPQPPPLAPPPSQQPSFAPPPVSSVIGGAPTQNPFARNPGQGFNRPTTNQGNYY